MDFEGLTARFDLSELCELAASKDLGFRRQHLRAALEYFDEISPQAFNAYTDDYEQLRECIKASRQRLDLSVRGVPSEGIEQ